MSATAKCRPGAKIVIRQDAGAYTIVELGEDGAPDRALESHASYTLALVRLMSGTFEQGGAA